MYQIWAFCEKCQEEIRVQEQEKNIILKYEKIITLLLLSGLIFLFSGCYEENNSTQITPESENNFQIQIEQETSLKKGIVIEEYDIYANGQALGYIDIFFSVSSVCRGALDYIEFSDDYNSLNFEFWHFGEYGPLEYDLERQ
ncbi:MAG: hypothetical protein GY754_09405 [bacterium]|nr:hypothetical protein [bacterium]